MGPAARRHTKMITSKWLAASHHWPFINPGPISVATLTSRIITRMEAIFVPQTSSMVGQRGQLTPTASGKLLWTSLMNTMLKVMATIIKTMHDYHKIVHFFFIYLRRFQSSLWALPVLRPDPCKVPGAATGRSGQEKGQGPARDTTSLLLYHETTFWREIQTPDWPGVVCRWPGSSWNPPRRSSRWRASRRCRRRQSRCPGCRSDYLNWKWEKSNTITAKENH